eukprot:6328907-Lingulodinium_polyedra.AAC.1
MAGPVLNVNKCVLVPFYECDVKEVKVGIAEEFGFDIKVEANGKCLGIFLGKSGAVESWSCPLAGYRKALGALRSLAPGL